MLFYFFRCNTPCVRTENQDACGFNPLFDFSDFISVRAIYLKEEQQISKLHRVTLLAFLFQTYYRIINPFHRTRLFFHGLLREFPSWRIHLSRSDSKIFAKFVLKLQMTLLRESFIFFSTFPDLSLRWYSETRESRTICIQVRCIMLRQTSLYYARDVGGKVSGGRCRCVYEEMRREIFRECERGNDDEWCPSELDTRTLLERIHIYDGHCAQLSHLRASLLHFYLAAVRCHEQ